MVTGMVHGLTASDSCSSSIGSAGAVVDPMLWQPLGQLVEKGGLRYPYFRGEGYSAQLLQRHWRRRALRARCSGAGWHVGKDPNVRNPTPGREANEFESSNSSSSAERARHNCNDVPRGMWWLLWRHNWRHTCAKCKLQTWRLADLQQHGLLDQLHR